MEDWIKRVIIQKCDELKREEKRQFMVAYAYLDEKYHGYLDALPLPIKVFNMDINDKEVKELAKEHGMYGDLYTSKGAVRFNVLQPYLGVDGCVAMLNDAQIGDVSVSFAVETVEGTSYRYVKAFVRAGSKTAEGMADLKETGRENDKELSFEKAASSAVRKACGYLGIGRLPITSTKYGDDADILAYRRFLKDRAEKNEKTNLDNGG